MKVVVTGGSGHAGHQVVKYLLQRGYEVTIVDRIAPQEYHAPYMLADLQDTGQAIGSLHGAEAVVHLAAIPRPTYHTNETVFQTNVVSTYNVLEAAAILGIKRVVYASSTSVTGYPFYYRFFAPQYVPIDEEHPTGPQDPYALSKYLGEEIAMAFVRRSDMRVISLRLAWIHTPETFKAEIAPNQNNPKFGASNLWLYVDARDVGQACWRALEANLQGHRAFYISAANTFMETPSVELVKQFYPDTGIRPGFAGNQSLVSTKKAEEMLAYKAEYNWENYS